MAVGPFTVDELVLRKGMTVMDALALVWDTSEEWFAEYLRERRTRTAAEVNASEFRKDAQRGPYVPHGGTVHHIPGESRH